MNTVQNRRSPDDRAGSVQSDRRFRGLRIIQSLKSFDYVDGFNRFVDFIENKQQVVDSVPRWRRYLRKDNTTQGDTAIPSVTHADLSKSSHSAEALGTPYLLPAETLANTAQGTDIVSYSPEVQKQTAGSPAITIPFRLKNLVLTTTRLSFLGVAIFVLWWIWPTSAEPPVHMALMENRVVESLAVVSQPDSLAIVNPENFDNRLLAVPNDVAEGEVTTSDAAPMPDANTTIDGSRTELLQNLQDIAVATTAPQPLNEASIPKPDEANRGTAANRLGVVSANFSQNIISQSIENQPASVSELEADSSPRLVLVPTPVALPTAIESVPPASENDSANTPRSLPRVKIVPALGLQITPTPTHTPSPTPTFTPTPKPVVLHPGRLWATFWPAPAPENDHFWLGRPFPDHVGSQLASANYQFGSTAYNRYRIHHGLDLSNPLGTPVQAAAEGEVVHAGLDDSVLLGAYNDFYGNAVVIRLNQRLAVAGGELDVYVLYGHLSEVYVAIGQQMQPTDIIGTVGMTGIAIGPHLHVEIRLGANTYQNNVNPYLWVRPLEGTGAVAVRVLTGEGRTWPGGKLTLARYRGNSAVWARTIEIYLDDENIGPDPAWGENGAMGSVPAGSYYLVGKINGQTVREELTVQASQTTFVEIRTQ